MLIESRGATIYRTAGTAGTVGLFLCSQLSFVDGTTCIAQSERSLLLQNHKRVEGQGQNKPRTTSDNAKISD
ncbi:hypothetical protein GGR52DRAFT_544635 [Hypoxylon sp. FL1284]|nr:hypothetical protein GGR52DRAFT_544635 [Hypoxylon sp. FL1284]